MKSEKVSVVGRLWRDRGAGRSPEDSSAPVSRKKVNEHNNQCNYQQNVDGSAHGITGQRPQCPENEKYCRNHVKHGFSFNPGAHFVDNH